MKKLIDQVNKIVQEAFEQCQYDAKFGITTLSNRPDLCQFQCNGALSAAKHYHKKPFEIATEIVSKLMGSPHFKTVECVMPGFINLTLKDELLIDSLKEMAQEESFGCTKTTEKQTIIVDYGGPNVAKPLHVGHLRTAVIGESIKRLGRFLGYDILGDVHLGDWGLQIGLILVELQKRHPEWIYFDKTFTGDYPITPPFTIGELEEIYPTASGFAKENPDFLEKAKSATFEFQTGHKGYEALWKHILTVSIHDLKKNYAKLNVFFDLWKKESDAQPYIPEMIQTLKDKGHAYLSEGALVVDVKKEDDKKEFPPCILVKSDGATLYSTTDLATIVERIQLYAPSEIIYIVDKRQEMHFEQVFRCAQKTHLVSDETRLTFLGFGTMNGKDGKPFKTRDGGVMRLENLIKEVTDKVYEKVISNPEISEKEAYAIAEKVGVAALKYGDLSNQISKDYVFDLERFTAFEGNTGPYILYTVVRMNSIKNKYITREDVTPIEKCTLALPHSETERDLMFKLTQFCEVIENSFKEYTPNKICQYIYELSNAFNRFYHHNKILTEQNHIQQASWIALIQLTQNILTCCLNILGIEVPEKM